jgi:hypothetical protein
VPDRGEHGVLDRDVGSEQLVSIAAFLGPSGQSLVDIEARFM